MQKKLGLIQKSEIIKSDYNVILANLKNEKFDLIFIDPPYANDIAVDAVNKIIELKFFANTDKINNIDNHKYKISELKNLEKCLELAKIHDKIKKSN